MYRFKDLGERDLALRPGVHRGRDARVPRARPGRPLARAPAVEHGPGVPLRPPAARAAIASSRRSTASWSARAAPGADVEMITLFVDLYEAWGFRDLTVKVNSVGQPASRRAYGERLRELAGAGARPAERRFAAAAGRRTRCACSTPRTRATSRCSRELRRRLPQHARHAWTTPTARTGTRCSRGSTPPASRYEVDHGLVRGLDYYTRTAFEVHDTLARRAERARRRRALRRADRGAGRRAHARRGLRDRARSHAAGAASSAGAPAAAADAVCVVAMDGTRAAAAALARELRREFAVECDVEARGVQRADEGGGQVGRALPGDPRRGRMDARRGGAQGFQDGRRSRRCARDALADALRARDAELRGGRGDAPAGRTRGLAPHAHLRRADARAQAGHDRDAHGLGASHARPRRRAVHRPARSLRAHAGGVPPRDGRRGAARARASRLGQRVRDRRARARERAARRRGQPRAGDRRDRGGRARAQAALGLRSAAVPGERGAHAGERGPAAQVPLPRPAPPRAVARARAAPPRRDDGARISSRARASSRSRRRCW